jgi:hypothetical protein
LRVKVRRGASAITASRQLPVQRWAADGGSSSIGFQFHRADVIDAARTGRASGTSMFLEIVPVLRMDEVLARAMTRKPEPIEWDETTAAAAAVPEEAPVEEEPSTLTAH